MVLQNYENLRILRKDIRLGQLVQADMGLDILQNCKSIKLPFHRGSNVYFMLSDRISRNIGENIFQSYTGTTSENTDFHVLVA